MIEIMLRNIISNNEKIDNIVKYINNTNKKNFVGTLAITICIYGISAVVSKQGQKINELEAELEGIKSKLA